MKVYCSRCQFYVPGYTIPYSFGPPDEIKEKCMCPENFYDAYVSEKIRPKSKPSIINRFNNCKWYEPKDGDPPHPHPHPHPHPCPSSSSSGDCSSSSSCSSTGCIGVDFGTDKDYNVYGECFCDKSGHCCMTKCEIEF